MPAIGPVFSLLLIGLILLCGLLYYRAVKIQRYLEPALAIAQPRNDFSMKIARLFQQEFGTEPINGLSIRAGSILVEKSLLFPAEGARKSPGTDENMQKLARLFKTLMEDDHLRSDISLILIGARFPLERQGGADGAERLKAQRMVSRIQDALFTAESVLGKRYGTYFLAATQAGPASESSGELIEFRIIPSELLHIEVLQKLVKYAF